MARIAVVLPSAGLGGAEHQAWLVAGRLQRAGHTVAVFTMQASTEGSGGDPLASVPRFPLPRTESRLRLVAAWRLRRAASRLRVWHPDALLPFCSAPNVLCGLWAGRGGPPAAWNQRDEGLFPQHPAHQARALVGAAMHIGNGPGAISWLLRHGVRAPRHVGNAVVLPPPATPRAAMRRRLGVPAEATVATMLATLSPAKDHTTLLQAWQAVEGRCADAWLVCAGADGGERPRQEAAARELGLRRVVWPGRIDDVSGLLAASDLGVLASRSEGLSNAILECRAAGLAIVGSDIPGIRAAAGTGAILVPPGDAAAMAAAIGDLITDPERRAALAARARDALAGPEALDAWLQIVDALLRNRAR